MRGWMRGKKRLREQQNKSDTEPNNLWLKKRKVHRTHIKPEKIIQLLFPCLITQIAKQIMLLHLFSRLEYYSFFQHFPQFFVFLL